MIKEMLAKMRISILMGSWEVGGGPQPEVPL